MKMTSFDFSPLFRSSIGFDRLTDALESATRADAGGYPPYDIELTGENNYRIILAVAGFTGDELEIEAKENRLTITGQKSAEERDRKFLHHGIAHRSFERNFQLADYVRVGGAELKDGLLHVNLVREIPEAMKTRKIEIQTSSERKAIEGEAA